MTMWLEDDETLLLEDDETMLLPNWWLRLSRGHMMRARGVLVSRMQPWASWTRHYSQPLTPPFRDVGVAPTRTPLAWLKARENEISLV